MQKEKFMDFPLTCVYRIHDVDLDSLEYLHMWDEDWNEWLTSPEYKIAKNHLYLCDLCKFCETNSDGIFSAETLGTQTCSCWENSSPRIWYTDGKWVQSPDGLWDAKEASILLVVNESTIQLLKSPETWKRGFASPCYPGQCCSDTDGSVVCYKLPQEFLLDCSE